ncbi:DNA repair protein REV1 [Pseudohyphozyma bogoriensis]|nr:DNA repair protein REV1 [Pseudohyphozyma bogoriensis]
MSSSQYWGDGGSDPAFEDSLLALDDDTKPSQSTCSSKRPLAAVSPDDDDDSPTKPPKGDYTDSSVYAPTGFGEFGQFMRNKRAKLRIQNDAILEDNPEERAPQIFKGLAVYTFDGDAPYLDRKSIVTHIVASNLTPKKVEEFKSYKVVLPAWLTDSAAAGKLLDWRQYKYGLVSQALVEESRLRIGLDEENDYMGTQNPQKSLWSMGLQTQAQKQAQAGSRPGANKGKAKEVNETMETLAARGLRLAQESIAATSKTSTPKPTAQKLFFQAPVTKPSSSSSASATTSKPVTTPALSRPTTPSKSTARFAPTTDSPTGQHNPYLPSKARSERTAALLQDPDFLAKNTSRNPNYCRDYFGNSRLHLISSVKEELKKFVVGLQPEKERVGRKKALKGDESDGRTIFHVDFDCFFVSAGLIKRPDLRGKAVAVCHGGKSEGAASTSEIASCSYEARAKGVKAGISLGRARELCPEIETLPFDFELYKSIAKTFYTILLSHADYLQAISIDEVLMEIATPPPSPSGSVDPSLNLANEIRAEIFKATGCPASIGISHNILLARLASKRAKPDGASHLLATDVEAHLAPLPVKDLPGIGWSLEDKLEEQLKVTTVGELRDIDVRRLKEVLGKENGVKFAAFARGLDSREVEVNKKGRGTVSADVNYGIRFNEEEQVEPFVRTLAEVVTARLQEAGLKTRTMTLKVMIRHPDASEDAPKFLGHGHCDERNLQASFGRAIEDSAVVGDKAWQLLRGLKIMGQRVPCDQLRGIGITLQKLEKDGVPTDVVKEVGQTRLSFGVPVKPKVVGVPTPAPVEAARPPPPVQAALKKDDSIIIISDSEGNSSPLPAQQPPPRRASSRAPSAAVAAPPPLKSKLPSKPPPKTAPLFKRPEATRRSLRRTASKVTDEELRELGIDPEAFRAVSADDQNETLATQRAKTLPVPVKNKLTQNVLYGQVSKSGVADSFAEKKKEKEKSKSVEPQLPSPSSITDKELKMLKLDVECFRALPLAIQQEQINDKRRWWKSGNNGTRAVNGAPRQGNLTDIKITVAPKLAGLTDLDEIRAFIEQWFEEWKEGPDGEDVRKVIKFLQKCLDSTKGQDLEKTTGILSWWKYLVESEYGEEGESGSAAPHDIDDGKGATCLLPQIFQDNMSKPSSLDEKDVGVTAAVQDYDGASVLSSPLAKFATTTAAHRTLESYHVNLISIGGTIGTALFVYMGSGLTQGGPLSLLLGYAYWVSVIWAIAECQREMVAQWPTDAPFSRNAARYIDTGAGFATALNFWLSQVALVIFEVVAFGVVIGYWASAAKVNDVVYITVTLVAYFLLNIWSTKFFGTAEFFFAIGKVLLITGLICMTFITMVGGNPQHKAFGFTYWKNPGAMTTPYPSHGFKTGRFEGFLACVINACFTVAGPDYLSMVAGEARNPRKTMARAFKATIYRLVIFFIGSALCIGILVPYNDANLLHAQATGAPGGAKSPYVIAMNRMKIAGLPHIVNALILTSVFSAGNAFQFCASRTLAQMSYDGQMPKIVGKRNRNGVPWIAVVISLSIALLSYCQLNTSASVVITWLTGLVGSAQLVNWMVMSATWLRWNAAYKAQGISRDTLYSRSRFAPWCAWYGLINSTLVMLMQGYYVFLKGQWSGPNFAFAYAMPMLWIVATLGWKLIFRSKFQRASTMDITSFINDKEFDEHEYEEIERSKVGTVVHKTLKTLF